MPNKRTREEVAADLGLIDHNIRYSRELVTWWCENCQRKLYYPAHAPRPQCPHCSTQGYTTRMKRYYGGISIITH